MVGTLTFAFEQHVRLADGVGLADLLAVESNLPLVSFAPTR